MHFRSKILYRLKKIFHHKKSSALIGIGFVLLILFYLLKAGYNDPGYKRTYTIGIDKRWRDIEIFGKEKNFNAFSHDLLLAIAREEKIVFNLMSIEPSELNKFLTNQQLQGVLTGLHASVIEKRTFEFSENAYALGPVLTVSSQAKFKNWNQLKRKILGVYAFSPIVLKLQKKYTAQIRLYDDIKRALADLDSEKIDGVIFPVLPSLTYTNTFYQSKLKVVTDPLNNEGVHLVSLNDVEGKKLIQFFNQGLEKIKKNGTYQKLLDRWNLTNTEQIPDAIPINPLNSM